jgi:hypothetical protein
METEDNAFIIQFKNQYDVWITDTIELGEVAAYRRAGHLLAFDYDEVRVITPSGEIIADTDNDS